MPIDTQIQQLIIELWKKNVGALLLAYPTSEALVKPCS